MAKLIPIVRKRGNTRRIVFHITDNVGDIDVTNFTELTLSINPSQFPTSADNSVEIMSGYVIDGLTGRVGFTPSGDVSPGDYFYDAVLTDDNGETFTFVQGTYSVTQGVTK